MAEGNMGITKKPSLGIAAMIDAPEGGDSEKLHYPSLRLEGQHIEAAGLTKAKPGDTFEATVKFKVASSKKSLNPAEYSPDRTELDITSITDVTKLDDEPSEDEESDEDKDLAGKMGFASAKGMKKGGGFLSPKKAGVKL